MSWTAPRTFVTGEVETAAIFNTHLRDNLTALQPQSAVVPAGQTTTSTSYTDLATTGPAVTVTTGTQALITVGCQSSNNNSSQGAYMSFAVSGATTVAANDANAFYVTSFTGGFGSSGMFQVLYTGLTAGSNTFTAKYRATGTTATFSARNIIVEACY